jgi:hypothetical protein
MLHEERAANETLMRDNAILQQKLFDMLKVMRDASFLSSDEIESITAVESLKTENEGLKELLSISESHST